MFKTILNTAYNVLIETVLYICAICVVMGVVSALFTEFGVVGLTQWLINPIMRPIYNMPGVASLGIITTFLSDNPAILALAQDKKTRSYFKKYQTPALCNLGTSFGMGMIVVTFMLGLGTEFVSAIGAGLFGCVSWAGKFVCRLPQGWYVFVRSSCSLLLGRAWQLMAV